MTGRQAGALGLSVALFIGGCASEPKVEDVADAPESEVGAAQAQGGGAGANQAVASDRGAAGGAVESPAGGAGANQAVAGQAGSAAAAVAPQGTGAVAGTALADPVDAASIARTPTPCLDQLPPATEPVRLPELDQSVPDTDTGQEEPSMALVIFDKSGSMADSWVADAEAEVGPGDTKWYAASDALISSLTPFQHRVTLGAILFPQPTDCSVAPIDGEQQIGLLPGPDFIAAWNERAPLNQPSGRTPLEAAFVAAEQTIEAACADGLIDRRFFVMVLTDGMPNCDVNMDAVEAMAAHWYAHGIATYVFGLPGSEAATDVLDRIARAGGTETLLVPGEPSALEEGMASMF